MRTQWFVTKKRDLGELQALFTETMTDNEYVILKVEYQGVAPRD